ncbi:MAG TPA: AAA family ATPase [Xanthobacteraceae bacterium]|nr:AAA family ATPase [Xanthobacteraceae bacterium]
MNDATESQEAVFALLADPATHVGQAHVGQAHGGHAVKRIDTHAASVFLAGERVLKVKRAVRFPFLDYSTLEKRKTACDTELAINRRTAPDIYRRVVAITREPDGRLALDGRGEPVEWALEMRRFDEEQTLDHLAARGKIDAALADALGRTVAASHADAEPADAARWIAALESYIDEHVDAFGQLPALFPPEENQAFAEAGRAAFTRVRALLTERGRTGFIRRIHGDLHLGNIVLLDNRPVLVDAIEFSEVIASGDVLYDLAFLLMDLVERDLTPAANVAFNRYLVEAKHDENLDALAALPFFLSMRAAIRAKVTAARLAHARPDEQTEITGGARAYFDWARRFIAPAPPVMVAVGGLSGTGKSVLARALAPTLVPPPGAVVIRSDVERKALFGKGELEPLPQEAYTPETTARVYAVIAEKARRTVAAGHSAILDAVFARPEEREQAERAASDAGVRLQGLFLEVDVATRAQRASARARDASDANADVVRTQESYDLGVLAWHRVDASGTPETILQRAKAALA